MLLALEIILKLTIEILSTAARIGSTSACASAITIAATAGADVRPRAPPGVATTLLAHAGLGEVVKHSTPGATGQGPRWPVRTSEGSETAL